MGAPYGNGGKSPGNTTLSQLILMDGFPSSAVSIGPRAQLHENGNSLDNSEQGLYCSSAFAVVVRRRMAKDSHHI